MKSLALITPLVVLAAGDSLTYNLSYGMQREFPPAQLQVHTDVSQGRGLSKPGFDWPSHGREIVEQVKPDVVFLFLGGNEGFPLGGAECCTPEWTGAFAAKQRELLQAYGRGGRTRVYWLNLPAPGPTRPGHRTTWQAENLALLSLTTNNEATMFDTSALLSPGFRFRRNIRCTASSARPARATTSTSPARAARSSPRRCCNGCAPTVLTRTVSFPGGTTVIERWENHLLCDALGVEPLPDGLAHPAFLFHLPLRGVQLTIEQMLAIGKPSLRGRRARRRLPLDAAPAAEGRHALPLHGRRGQAPSASRAAARARWT